MSNAPVKTHYRRLDGQEPLLEMACSDDLADRQVTFGLKGAETITLLADVTQSGMSALNLSYRGSVEENGTNLGDLCVTSASSGTVTSYKRLDTFSVTGDAAFLVDLDVRNLTTLEVTISGVDGGAGDLVSLWATGSHS